MSRFPPQNEACVKAHSLGAIDLNSGEVGRELETLGLLPLVPPANPQPWLWTLWCSGNVRGWNAKTAGRLELAYSAAFAQERAPWRGRGQPPFQVAKIV